jgi:hypothetical protein
MVAPDGLEADVLLKAGKATANIAAINAIAIKARRDSRGRHENRMFFLNFTML